MAAEARRGLGRQRTDQGRRIRRRQLTHHFAWIFGYADGVSGSGPAYVFYFLEALEQAARELGFSEADARKLAYTTFAGAMTLAQKSDADPATLRAQVTSKGGTTERALTTLEANRVKAGIVAAVKDAAKRAQELGEEFGRDS